MKVLMDKNQLNDNLCIKVNEKHKRLLYEGKYLKDILKLTEEEFTLIKERTNKLFVNIFGPDLSLKASFANTSYEERLIFYIFIDKYEENKNNLNCYFKDLTLSEITNIRYTYLKKYLIKLDVNSNKRKLLVKYFGLDLKEKFKENLYFNEDISDLINIISEIEEEYKKYLNYYKEVWRNKTLCDLTNCPNNKINCIINKLNKKSYVYKLLSKAFGNEFNNTCNIDALSNNELIDLESILMWFRQKYYVKTELIYINMDDMYIKFKHIAYDKKYFYDYLDEAISLIPQHMIIIERLLNGIVNNKVYTIKKIANMFCLTSSEINYILDQSSNLLNLLLKAYKDVYNIDVDVSKSNLLCRIK